MSSLFRPTRASSPAKPPRNLEQVEKFAADISRASTNASVPELTDLSPSEIDLLDTVIDRAGPSSTTFLGVFKAYNDVLHERGLNPQEVVYYGKLLKLGTMKGKNWGDKWNAIKSQYSPSSARENCHTRNEPPRPKYKTPRRGVDARAPPTEDTYTVHAHAGGNGTSTSSIGLTVSTNRPQRRPRAQTISSQASHDPKSHSRPLFSIPAPTPPSQYIPMREYTEEPSDSEDNYAPSTTPPSYLAATAHQQPPTSRHLPKVITSAIARKVVANAREQRGSNLNDEDAWKKIRMQRDEADADAFRRTQSLERCFKVWKQEFHWIVMANEKIVKARDDMILEFHLQRWKNAFVSRHEIYQRITTAFDNRRRRKILTIWRNHLKEREQNKWRRDMRQKMKTIREKREHKLCKDAWAKWRQQYRSHLADHHYIEHFAHRFFERWKQQLSTISQFEMIADDAFQVFQERKMEYYLDRWRTAKAIRVSEQVISERIGLRLMHGTMTVWRKNMYGRRVATGFYRLILLKSSINAWKARRDRIHVCAPSSFTAYPIHPHGQTFESRALKHVARQDAILLRAVYRIWKVRSQGKALEQVKKLNLMYAALSVWKQQLLQQRHNNNLAVDFARSKSSAVVSSFRKWQEKLGIYRSAHLVAVQYHSEQLYPKALLIWRIKLRDKRKMARRARDLDYYFSTRRAWRAWKVIMKGRMVEKRLRLLRNALTVWTNRVIAVKLQELDAEQNYNITVQTATFEKWRTAYARRSDLISLMQNVLLIKREENMRRVFFRWLNLARLTRQRRITLQEKEDEIKFSVIAYTWDKWRGRFSDEKLRPLVNYHYSIARSELTLLAGTCCDATDPKEYIIQGLRLMAFEDHGKYLDTWTQAYHKKIDLKAVAYVIQPL
ncbi:hypothetical protein C0991_008227 [Blastosporella zonata]|nr:hypothetical protein C0991_008227 [Blastosporella zonata]